MESLFPSPYFRGLILVTALGFMALEYGIGRLVHRETHDWRESAATLGVAVVQNIIRLIEAGIVAIPFAFVHQHRLFDFSDCFSAASSSITGSTAPRTGFAGCGRRIGSIIRRPNST
jgi:hypothetical protein